MKYKTHMKRLLLTSLALMGILILMNWQSTSAHADKAPGFPPPNPVITGVSNPYPGGPGYPPYPPYPGPGGPGYPGPGHPGPGGPGGILPGDTCPLGIVVTTYAGAQPICQHAHTIAHYDRAIRICNYTRYPVYLYETNGKATLYAGRCTEAILLTDVVVYQP